MNLTSEDFNVGLVLGCFIKQLTILYFEIYSYISDTTYAEFFPHDLPYCNTVKTEKSRDIRNSRRVNKRASYGRSNRYFILEGLGEASLC